MADYTYEPPPPERFRMFREFLSLFLMTAGACGLVWTASTVSAELALAVGSIAVIAAGVVLGIER